MHLLTGVDLHQFIEPHHADQIGGPVHAKIGFPVLVHSQQGQGTFLSEGEEAFQECLFFQVCPDGQIQKARDVLKEFGTIDILVNNAGYVIPEQSWFKDETADYWDKVIDVCYKGTIYCSRAVLDTMIEKKNGKICSIASDAARVGQRGQAVYSGAKGAVIAFSKALAQEVAYYKINVNCVCPGATRTPGMDSMPKEMQEKIAKSYLFRRVAEPLDIANVVCFLTSELSEYMTGQTLSVSSGYTMI